MKKLETKKQEDKTIIANNGRTYQKHSYRLKDKHFEKLVHDRKLTELLDLLGRKAYYEGIAIFAIACFQREAA